jgi:predicted amidophosphoribosyltransferase
LVDAIIKKDNEICRLKKELNDAVSKKTCPNCKTNISKTAVYCSSCGAKVED